MTLLDLIGRWLAYRGADVERAGAPLRVALAPGDRLMAVLGERFTLAELTVDAPVPPGVEPVYPGCRITDLMAGDLEPVTGIALLQSSGVAGPHYVFSFHATYTTDKRAERLLRVTLTAEGALVPLPSDPDPPLRTVGHGAQHLEMVERLFGPALKYARDQALEARETVERQAQERLWRTAQRLARYQRTARGATGANGEDVIEYRRRLAEEVERHRLRLTLRLLGVTVVIPEP